MNRMGHPGPMPNGTPSNGHLRYMQGPPSSHRRPYPPHMQAHMMQPQRPTKKKTYGDKMISNTIRELVPESDAYMDLLDYEKKLDATITRKRLEIQEALKKPMKVKRKLRIYVSHTFTASSPESDDKPDKGWELRVEGQLIDSENAKNRQLNGRGSVRKFSSFFKRLIIELDPQIYGPDTGIVEWTRSPGVQETDGFQVKRPGDRDVKCQIRLWLEHSPPKYKLSPRLAKVLGIAMDTRHKIMEVLWEYIKVHKLQDPVEKEYINLDDYLQQIFRTKRMRFGEVPQFLSGHLCNPDPIELLHVIRDVPDEKSTACYDIEVEVDDPIKMNMNAFIFALQRQQTQQSDLQMLEARIAEIVEQINEGKTKRDFFARFTQNPVKLIDSWVVSQNQDLKVMTEALYESEHEKQSDCFFQPSIQEGVNRYIFNKTQQKRVEVEQSIHAMLLNGHSHSHNHGHGHAQM